ncbi:hypothetical protein CIB48_g8570 [Xylaria polymorpha]|nr:hypothetical protein CIB48_g8570 [Xylaria polymorpha]
MDRAITRVRRLDGRANGIGLRRQRYILASTTTATLERQKIRHRTMRNGSSYGVNQQRQHRNVSIRPDSVHGKDTLTELIGCVARLLAHRTPKWAHKHLASFRIASSLYPAGRHRLRDLCHRGVANLLVFSLRVPESWLTGMHTGDALVTFLITRHGTLDFRLRSEIARAAFVGGES